MIEYIAAAYIATTGIMLIVFIVTLKQYLNKKAEFASKSNKNKKK